MNTLISTRGAAIAPNAMTTNDNTYLPSHLLPWTVGFDRQFELLREMADAINPKSRTFPPCDIIKFSDDEYAIDLAVAGFSEDDLEIEVKDSMLTITGSRPDFEDEEYLHRGIGKRSFTQKYALAEHVEVIGAKLRDGILRIDLERQLPEELKPRTVKITTG